MKIEHLLGERAAEKRELEFTRSRVEELQEEQKNNRETIGQLSAQRDELERSRDQHLDDMNALRAVSKTVTS